MPSNSLVYVVDDDPAARDSLVFLLKSARLPVKSFESADNFISDLQSIGDCGCVITDVRMPGMSGIDLLKRLRKEGHATPVIVMTGHGDVPLAVEAMKHGAADFLEKPYDDEVMLTSVRNALSRREKDDKHQQEKAAV